MLHISCDLCGKRLDDERYVVRVEIYPAFDPEELGEDIHDVEHLQAVSDTIEAIESGQSPGPDDCGARRFRFDLCDNCQHRFVEDPLGRDAHERLNFSEN